MDPRTRIRIHTNRYATLPSGLGQGAQGARQGRDGGQADHPGARQGAGQALEGARQTRKVVLQGS